MHVVITKVLIVKERINLLREFSIPLLGGVVLALVWANSAPESYAHFLYGPFLGPLSFHFLTNDIFMVFFFGIAAVEITQSFLPGGDLYPVAKSVNPLLATAGGVIGPALVYLMLNHIIGTPELQRGWGIPTATDIAFAWLVARLIFGNNHPAISFLLLLAVADDGIGLAIIALFYPDPRFPVEPLWLLLTLAGMLLAYALKKQRIRSYWPYIIMGGSPLLGRTVQGPSPPGTCAGFHHSVPAACDGRNEASFRRRSHRPLNHGAI